MSAPVAILIEDEPQIRRFVRAALEAEGWVVHEADTAKRGLLDAGTRKPDLLVVDLGLPDGDGLDLIRDVRGWSNVPIVVLSARADETDKIAALDAGADDYLPKPFNPRELVARIHAVMRRQPQTPPGAPAADDEDVSFGQIVVQLGTRILVRNGEETLLTTGEFALLKVLLQHPRQPLSRDRLMELARGREYDVFDRSIDVQISRLRKLIEEDPGKPRYIQTVWGFGYVFVPDGNKHAAP